MHKTHGENKSISTPISERGAGEALAIAKTGQILSFLSHVPIEFRNPGFEVETFLRCSYFSSYTARFIIPYRFIQLISHKRFLECTLIQ